MRKIFSSNFWHLPEFMRNDQLQLIGIFLVVISLTCTYLAFTQSLLFGAIVAVIVVLIFVITYLEFQQITKDTNEYISELTYRIKRGEQEALIRMPIGVLILNKDDEVEWANPYIQRYFGKEDVIGHQLKDIDKQLGALIEENWDVNKPVEVTWNDSHFEMIIQKDIKAVYLMDITHYYNIQERYRNTRLVVGQIFLDNYDEVTKTMSDETISNVSNYITTALSDWAHTMGVFLKRVDEDHFFMLGYRQSLVRIENRKFKILDKIRKDTSKQNSPITLSIGIAYGGDDLNELSKQAQSNMDLALGRGGDQAVVREVNSRQPRFYGGKTNPMEKRTRVRARMISQALKELISQADQLFVMGHKTPDMDSLGACLGIRRIAEMNGKECWIVVDDEHQHSDIQRLMREINNYQSIKDHIISPAEAMERATGNSLLVMVDHAKKSITISPELYEKLQNRLVIIDHHRRGEEFPENPLLVYIEPYASSTCELITEMFEYQPREGEGLNKLEATTMLTGIQIDTKSFTKSAGTRTFDAASYLRSAGADGMMIQSFMKEDSRSFMQRNHLLARAEINSHIAICAGEEDRYYDSVTAAQAADMLLQISDVDASFVITKRTDGEIGVSARSLGDFNVQVIMEKMGGGGHLANAATQISGKTIADVKQELLDILNHKDTAAKDEEETEE